MPPAETPTVFDGPRRLGRDLTVGSLAALASPRLIDSGLSGMLAWTDAVPSALASAPTAERPVRVAHRALVLLSKLPGGRWRNTCLFRSVAECSVRRQYGASARVAIGVDKVDGDVVAHSWVEVAGRDERDSRAMKPLYQSSSAVAD